MIFEWLVGDFNDLFAHDSQARVLLWYDAKEEFRHVLPDVERFAAHEGLSVLAVDPARGHGPLWVKWAAETGSGVDQRVVIWIPCAREALRVDSTSGLRLDVLFEYQQTAVEWRIDGRQPTLFGFLKKHGVSLPTNRAEQDALWRGGPESPLARYVKKHAERDEVFWQSRALSLAVVQEGIVGNVEDRLLRVLADPEGELSVMREECIVDDFRSQLASELAEPEGIDDDPSRWCEDFVTSVALLEVFQGTGSADDFPFASRLPSVQRRERQLKFLRRWMRDSEYGSKYREWALKIEPTVDLVAWAHGRDRRPQALRALVRDRWATFQHALQAVGANDEAEQLLRREKTVLQEESKGFWAQHDEDVPGWALAVECADLSAAAVRACNSAASRKEPKSLMDAYAREWHAIDFAHWQLLARASRLDDMELIAQVGDRFYFAYLQCAGQAFYESFRDDGVWPPTECPSVRRAVERVFAMPSKGEKKAVLVVDAMQYCLGAHIAEKLEGAHVEALVADVPSETWVGMTAWLPGCDAKLDVDGGGHRLASVAAGGDLCYSQYRKKLLAAAGAGALPAGPDGKLRDQIIDVLGMSEAPDGLPDLLVLFDRGIDSAGHGLGGDIVHYFEQALDSTRRAIRRLQSWGYSEVHIVTDHGFVLLDSGDAVQKMEVDRGAFADSGNRWGILAKGATAPTAVVPFGLDPEWSVAVPPGIRSFARPGPFFHGGATLQEVVVPHITIKSGAGAVLRLRVEALLPVVDIATMTVKVELRPVPPETATLLDTVQGASVDVFFGELGAPRSSKKTVEFDAGATEATAVTLFLDREPAILQGTEIPLRVIDTESGESYVSGLFIRAARDLS